MAARDGVRPERRAGRRIELSVKKCLTAAVLLVALGLVALVAFLRHGVSARDEPWAVEAAVARRLRALAIPVGARALENPVGAIPEVLDPALAHFADHCAVCHANDGSGETELGRGMYPKPPDMRGGATQDMTDGELFYIIRNGVRFTGMPGFASAPAEEDLESWGLVRFIRRLPEISPEELERMRRHNPVSRQKLEEEAEIRRFLEGAEDH